MIDNKQRGCLT